MGWESVAVSCGGFPIKRAEFLSVSLPCVAFTLVLRRAFGGGIFNGSLGWPVQVAVESGVTPMLQIRGSVEAISVRTGWRRGTVICLLSFFLQVPMQDIERCRYIRSTCKRNGATEVHLNIIDVRPLPYLHRPQSRPGAGNR